MLNTPVCCMFFSYSKKMRMNLNKVEKVMIRIFIIRANCVKNLKQKTFESRVRNFCMIQTTELDL